jgi:hypothetical protein
MAIAGFGSDEPRWVARLEPTPARPEGSRSEAAPLRHLIARVAMILLLTSAQAAHADGTWSFPEIQPVR